MKFSFKKLFRPLVINTILLSSLQVHSERMLFYIQYEDSSKADQLKNFTKNKLIKTYGLPNSFITTKKVYKCPDSALKESLIHICIYKNGDHRLLRAQHRTLKSSYAVYQKLASEYELDE